MYLCPPLILHDVWSELAFQISDQFAVLGGSLNLRTAVIVGGMDMMSQAIELGNRPHVVVATPGRIVDHLRSSNGEWNLSKVKFLVRVLPRAIQRLINEICLRFWTRLTAF